MEVSKIDEGFINKMIALCDPFFPKGKDSKPLVPDYLEPEYYNQYDHKELMVYVKLRDMVLSKLWSELYGTKAKYFNNVSVKNGIITYDGSPGYEEAPTFAYEERYDFLETGNFFWQDGFTIEGGEINDEEGLTDFYLSEGTSLEVNFEGKKTIEEMKTVEGGEAMIHDLMNWWKEPYQKEMVEATAEICIDMLNENCYGETAMNYHIAVNMAIKPFLDWLRKNHRKYKAYQDPVVKFTMKLIQELRYPCYLMSASICNKSWGFTENLFWNLQCYGYEYDAELIKDNMRVRAEIAYKIIDDVLVYLDKKYDFLPEDIKKFYNETEEREVEAA